MDWEYQEQDRELFERELETFVPPRIFDAHAHLYDTGHLGSGLPPLLARGPERADWETFQERIAQITPGRRTSALCFGFPGAQVDFAGANAFLIQEVRRDPGARGQMLIHPSMDPEFIRETVRREQFAGLKCYHVYAAEQPTYEAAIPSYLPEAHVRVAHEEGLSITLHMVRARAMADPSNQEVLRRWGERYPNARFILAHAARGFNPHHTIRGIGALRGLRNIWCDTSAVTDAGAFEAILHTLGRDRLLYGSDFPISHQRARCVALGDSFLWISADNTDLNAPYAQLRPTFVGLESLRTLKVACMSLALSDREVEAIFYGNAAELYGLG